MTGHATSAARVRTWGRHLLLIAESAVGIALVVAGSLILASFIVLRSQDAGFDTDGLAVLETRAAPDVTAEERETRVAQTLERVRRVPGVTAVATVRVPVLENACGGSQFRPPAGAERFFANDIPSRARSST